MPTVLLKLISEYWFLFSETIPRFIPNLKFHYIHDITFSQRNGKIILATTTDEYYKSNLLIYDLNMQLILRTDIAFRVRKILSSKLSCSDGTIYIVVDGYSPDWIGRSDFIIIYSFHEGILNEFQKRLLLHETPIFIDKTDTIYYKLGHVIQSVSIRGVTECCDHPVRSFKDDFAVTDDGVLFSLEKVVKEGSEIQS